MWDYLVLFMIVSPIEPSVSPQAPPEAWQALKTISFHLEIVGPHENWASDFRSELRYVRHYARLLREAPPLMDCELLPPTWIAAEFCRFNEQYQCHLRGQRFVCSHRADDICATLRETRQLHLFWDSARCATSSTQAWAYRRRTLKDMRDLIGAEAFYSGRLPPSVPVWRFREID
jgi:hypothetical protein